MKNFQLTFLLLIFIYSINCSSREKTNTEEIIDGVRHVHNLAPLWGDEQKISMEFVQKIGELEGDDENYQLFRPEDVFVDDDGNVHILDSGNCNIKTFSRSGVFRSSFGSRGQGPGEFDLPTGITTDSDGRIYIYDLNFRGFQIFDTSGRFIRSFKNGIITLQIKMLSCGELVAMNSSVIDPETINEKPLIAVLNQDGDILKTFGKNRIYTDQRMTLTANMYYFALSDNDEIFITFYYQNRIEKYSKDGELLLKIDRKLDYGENETLETVEYSGSDGRLRTRDVMNVFSTAIQVDSEDRIWVLTVEKQEIMKKSIEGSFPEENMFMFEVFDKDGILMCNIRPEEGIIPYKFTIHNKRIFIFNSIDMCIYEYRIVES
ncbi:NHL repeat-containing protein [candidate division KSB1 bacterium]